MPRRIPTYLLSVLFAATVLFAAYNIITQPWSASEALVCRPKHIDLNGNEVSPEQKSQTQYDKLADRLRVQVDSRQGNLTDKIRRAFYDGQYPVVFLPRLQDGWKTTDVRIFGVEDWKDQKCRGRGLIEYEAVPHMRLSRERFDWN